MIQFGTVCSGIGAPEIAWQALGWRCAFMSEIDAFPRAVLSHHYPEVPLHGDFTTIQAGDYAPIDLLVGGTPCQSFSVAGLRGGMADERGNLALEFLRLADRLRPRWLVWENVPGVLSSNKGRDFGAFLGGLGELGYGFAYRVLDAQFFGLAQRRQRVFVVGYLGDWRPAAAVLFEPASLRGDPAPRREAGERAAPTLAARTRGGGGLGTDAELDGALIAGTLNANGKAAGSATQQDAESGMLVTAYDSNRTSGPLDVATAVRAKGGSGHGDFETETFIATTLRARDMARGVDSDCTDTLIAHTLRAEGFDASEDGTGRGTPLVPVAAPLTSGSHPNSNAAGRRREDDTNLVAHGFNAREDLCFYGDQAGALGSSSPQAQAVAFASSGRGWWDSADTGATLRAQDSVTKADTLAAQGMAVRRLTPRECERLQGFPDDFTHIPYRNGMAADGPRYRALGNSMAVPVVRWIGERIGLVNAQFAKARHAA